jgi:dihydrofolate reductase
LKDHPGKDLVAIGGAGLAASLMAHNFVDEYRLMVTPTLLGGGKRLFGSDQARRPLTLSDAKRMDTGSMILHYRNT